MIFPDLGTSVESLGLIELEKTSGQRFSAGKDGVPAIAKTGDGKVEFVRFRNNTRGLCSHDFEDFESLLAKIKQRQ